MRNDKREQQRARLAPMPGRVVAVAARTAGRPSCGHTDAAGNGTARDAYGRAIEYHITRDEGGKVIEIRVGELAFRR